MNFYQFAKKSNSTKRPAGSPTTYNCTLKEPCNIMSPVIGLDLGLTTNPHAYNYAYIAAFGRYYYVSNWEYSGRLWWASLAVDVLATYRAEILNTSCYVARSAAAYNGDIMDALYPTKAGEIAVQEPLSLLNNTPWAQSLADGMYVVGIINNDNLSFGAVSYYAFTPSNFALFKNYLMADANWTGILTTNPDIGENLYKSIFNPYQYIVSINWFPFEIPSNIGLSTTVIPFGWWVIENMNAYRISNYIYTLADWNSALTVREHPQAQTRGSFVLSAPYSKYRLIFPPWGEFELDANLIAKGQWQQFDTVRGCDLGTIIKIDFISGIGILYVYVRHGPDIKDQATLLINQTMVGVPIQLAQINTNGWGQVQNIVSTAAGVLGSIAKLDVGGAISNAATGIINTVENNIPHMQSIGSTGSIAPYVTHKPKIETVHKILVDENRAEMGRPLCETRTLSTLTGNGGYVLTRNADVQISGYDAEISAINNLLNNGIYLE